MRRRQQDGVNFHREHTKIVLGKKERYCTEEAVFVDKLILLLSSHCVLQRFRSLVCIFCWTDLLVEISCFLSPSSSFVLAIVLNITDQEFLDTAAALLAQRYHNALVLYVFVISAPHSVRQYHCRFSSALLPLQERKTTPVLQHYPQLMGRPACRR